MRGYGWCTMIRVHHSAIPRVRGFHSALFLHYGERMCNVNVQHLLVLIGGAPGRANAPSASGVLPPAGNVGDASSRGPRDDGFRRDEDRGGARYNSPDSLDGHRKRTASGAFIPYLSLRSVTDLWVLYLFPFSRCRVVINRPLYSFTLHRDLNR